MAGIAGSMPYGASTLTGVDGARRPIENDRLIARFQGRHVAEITMARIAGRNAMRSARSALVVLRLSRGPSADGPDPWGTRGRIHNWRGRSGTACPQRGRLCERVQKRFCRFEVDRVETFGKPVKDRPKERRCLGETAPIAQ
jgi:hypothetical protein